MAIVGVLVHTDPGNVQVQEKLATLQGVDVHTFDVPGQIALVIESDNVRQAHNLLDKSIATTEGVLATYPIYTHFGDIEEGDE